MIAFAASTERLRGSSFDAKQERRGAPSWLLLPRDLRSPRGRMAGVLLLCTGSSGLQEFRSRRYAELMLGGELPPSRGAELRKDSRCARSGTLLGADCLPHELAAGALVAEPCVERLNLRAGHEIRHARCRTL